MLNLKSQPWLTHTWITFEWWLKNIASMEAKYILNNLSNFISNYFSNALKSRLYLKFLVQQPKYLNKNSLDQIVHNLQKKWVNVKSTLEANAVYKPTIKEPAFVESHIVRWKWEEKKLYEKVHACNTKMRDHRIWFLCWFKQIIARKSWFLAIFDVFRLSVR